MPLLIDCWTGLGVFEPTAYSLSMRSEGCQVNTLNQALRSVQFLYETLEAGGINLLERVKTNELLTLGEIEALVARCKFVRAELFEADSAIRSSNVVALKAPLKKGRTSGYGIATVKGDTTAIRLHYIAAYLKWFSDYACLLNLPSNRAEFRALSNLVVNAVRNRSPKATRPKKRFGLTGQQEQRLLTVTSTDVPENPWPDGFVRNRNHIIVWLRNLSRPSDVIDRVGAQADIARQEKLPSVAAIEGMAHVFRNVSGQARRRNGRR